MPCCAEGSLLGGFSPHLAGAGARRARCPRRAPVTVPRFSSLRFWRRPRGLPARSGVSGVAVPPSGRRGSFAGLLTCGGEHPGAARRCAGEERGAPAPRREGARSCPARCPSRLLPPALQRAALAERSPLSEGLRFAKCLRSLRARFRRAGACARLAPPGWGSAPTARCRGHRARRFLRS